MENMNLGVHGGKNGINFDEFTELITQLEQFGADLDQVAERVLDAGSEPARRAFQKNVPYDESNKDPDHEHARDNIVVSRTRTARKTKNKYRLIGALDRRFEYLYYVEYGTTKAPPHPFIEKAYRDAQAAASEPMRQALLREFDRYVR